MEINAMPLFGITPFEAKKMRNDIKTIRMTVCKDQITIPVSVYKAFGCPKYVEVGFNDEKRFFGVRPCAEPTKYSIEIGESYSHPISRKALNDKIESLRPHNSKNCNLLLDKGQYDSESGYWLFDLDCAVEMPRKSTKGRK